MSTSLLYHTQGIQGFKHVKFTYRNGCVVEEIAAMHFSCRFCRSRNVSVYKRGRRVVTGLPYGCKPLLIAFDVHSIYCHNCQRQSAERFPFLSSPKSRITKQLERTLVEYRSSMSVLALSSYFSVRWHTIKAVLVRHLRKEYEHVSCKGVTAIGIDEIMVGHLPDGRQDYKTIVRDLHSGAVLWVGDGKGQNALDGFGKRLIRSNANIQYVTMDLGHPFSAWVKANLPNAVIVYDHFHVIKLMNEAVDKVRRRVMSEMDEEERLDIKRQRFIFLRNKEDLKPETQMHLERLNHIYKDLGTVHMMKEDLRSIYRVCTNRSEGACQLKQWATSALQTAIRELVKMGKCVMRHLDGIASFWENRLTNSHMEGFNSKLRGMIKMAYGYRDEEFFKLKIYDLPDNKIIDLTHVPLHELKRQIVFGYSTT